MFFSLLNGLALNFGMKLLLLLLSSFLSPGEVHKVYCSYYDKCHKDSKEKSGPFFLSCNFSMTKYKFWLFLCKKSTFETGE